MPKQIHGENSCKGRERKMIVKVDSCKDRHGNINCKGRHREN